MERCQFSRLTIPNDPTYAETAAVYAWEVARILGFGEQACSDVKAGVAEAVTHIMQRSFDPGQEATIEVSCERVPMGLEVVVKDWGLPFGPSDIPFHDSPHEVPGASSGRSAAGGPWDQVSLHNLGHDGKETRLIKYLQNPAINYHDSCEVPLLDQQQAKRDRRPGPVEFEVRPMLPSEAEEVARCFYRSYGYSFVFQQIYYPDRIVELNEAGRLFSVVAVTNEGEIIGHCAFVRWDENPRTAELGFAVVKPEFRGHGCLRRLTGYLVDKAIRDELDALYVLAATNHTHSQKAAHRFGFKPCALLAGLGPASVSFRELTNVLPQRESYLVCFNFLRTHQPVTLYVPDHRRDFVRELYRNIGVIPRFGTPSTRELKFLQAHSKVRTMYFTTTGFAFIEIDEYGADIVSEVRAALKDLCLKRIEVIELYCAMTNPLMYNLTAEFEKLGFFVAGIKPASSHGEAMIFQYLNNVLVDYDKIKTLTPEGDRIRSYLRNVDPNYIGGGNA
jgi:RimJ/RimL family protein N-acetyltransferase/anti-sigma regulatory factor (Ser/Thr protein kinase)